MSVKPEIQTLVDSVMESVDKGDEAAGRKAISAAVAHLLSDISRAADALEIIAASVRVQPNSPGSS